MVTLGLCVVLQQAFVGAHTAAVAANYYQPTGICKYAFFNGCKIVHIIISFRMDSFPKFNDIVQVNKLTFEKASL